MDKLFRLFFGLACLMLATGQGIPVGLLNVRFFFCLVFCPTSRPTKFTNRLIGVIDKIKNNWYTSADRLCQFSVRLGYLMFSSYFVAKIIVFASQMNVTNSECGTSRACFTDPAGCNPETNTSCLFVSTQSSSGNLNFQLRGESAGFIAVVLSVDTTAVSSPKCPTYTFM